MRCGGGGGQRYLVAFKTQANQPVRISKSIPGTRKYHNRGTGMGSTGRIPELDTASTNERLHRVKLNLVIILINLKGTPVIQDAVVTGENR